MDLVRFLLSAALAGVSAWLLIGGLRTGSFQLGQKSKADRKATPFNYWLLVVLSGGFVALWVWMAIHSL